MPVEISILSGSKQGSRLQLPDVPFDVGSLDTDAIQFDPQSDPSVIGQRVSVWPASDGWRIRSTGALPITVNDDIVPGTRALRSGDIVRLSEDGPDFAFALIGRIAPHDDMPPHTTHGAPHGAAGVPLPVPEPLSLSRVAISTVTRRWAVWGGVGLLVLFVATLALSSLMRLRRENTSAATADAQSVQLAPIEALTIDEGQTLLWRPTVVNRGTLGAEVRFRLGDFKPDGMEIDAETGTIQWTPTEQQGPQQLKVPLEIITTTADQTDSRSETLFIVVNEVNQPPVIAMVRPQTINLLVDPALELTVTAVDPDWPEQQLAFAFGSDAPEGMTIDQQTGELTWRATERDANKAFTVTIHVADGHVSPLVATTELHVSVVSPDPLEFAAQQLSDAVYLVGAQPPGLDSFYPLGTACAVAEDLLVTNATVATAVSKAEQVEWRVVVVRAADIGQRTERGIPITRSEVHRAYVETDDAGLQAFFDLGLLMVDHPLAATCPLATEKELAELSINQTFGCFGFTTEKAALTRFDSPVPELRRLKLTRVLLPDAGSAGPVRLLELVGEVPPLAYGSLIINSAGKLLGVYALSARGPDEESTGREMHYAPVVTVVAMRLGDQDTSSHWVVPAPPTTSVPEETD